MKRKSIFASLLFMLIIGCAACSPAEPDGKTGQNTPETSSEKTVLTVSAAASLQDVLSEIKKSFENKYSTVDVTYNFGSSGTLAQQISQGAPVDLFFSAAEDKFDHLVKKGLIDQKSNIDLLGNELVLIVPKETEDDIQSFTSLANAEKIAIGMPETVPAGQYAKEALQHLHIWRNIEKKVVYAKDVRQVLTYVETGNVDAGIVYKTDAFVSSKVKAAATADGGSHTPIVYPAGIILKSAHPAEAKLFYQYLQSAEAAKVFEKYGFKGLNE